MRPKVSANTKTKLNEGPYHFRTDLGFRYARFVHAREAKSLVHLGIRAVIRLGSAYGFLQRAWPFGIVEAIWPRWLSSVGELPEALGHRRNFNRHLYRPPPVETRLMWARTVTVKIVGKKG